MEACACRCLRCLLLVMCTHSFAKEALTLHLARSESHERYFGCNLMHRKVLASFYQHLTAEAPPPRLSRSARGRITAEDNDRARAGARCAGLSPTDAPIADSAKASGIDRTTLYRRFERGRAEKNGIIRHFRHTLMGRRRCLRCLLLVMCTHPFAKKALTLHLAHGEGHEHYFGCNLMHRKVLASSHQHLMAEAPRGL